MSNLLEGEISIEEIRRRLAIIKEEEEEDGSEEKDI